MTAAPHDLALILYFVLDHFPFQTNWKRGQAVDHVGIALGTQFDAWRSIMKASVDSLYPQVSRLDNMYRPPKRNPHGTSACLLIKSSKSRALPSRIMQKPLIREGPWSNVAAVVFI